MNDVIERGEVFVVSLPRDTPYLGPLEHGVAADAGGYFVRPGNRTVYNLRDQSVLLRLTTRDGAVGWGECMGLIAPRALAAILEDLLVPMLVGRDPHAVASTYDDLYDAMRVRGFFGGYYHDAIAAADIAMWDLRGKLTGLPLYRLLGRESDGRIPAYVSGLPRATVGERAELAAEWAGRGFGAVKFAAAVSSDGELAEMRAIREAVGPDVRILVDLHWRYTAAEAVGLIGRLEQHDLYLAEAPVAPEDIEGLAQVARSVRTPVAIGEELRTVHEYLPRLTRGCMSVIQPEMGRTGVTAFAQILGLARAFHCRVMPHATIGVGLFQAASLHATAGLPNCPYHEYQHSVFDRGLEYLNGDMSCEAGFYSLPTGPGLGVEPTEALLRAAP